MSSRRLPTLPWLVLALTVTGPASAQGPSASDHDQAVTLFQAGRRFVEQNDCKEAIPRFLDSLTYEQTVGARFNLAECSEKEGRIADAWNQFKVAEQLAIAKKDDRSGPAHEGVARLEPKVTKLRLALPKDVPELVVKIDGAVVRKADHDLLTTGYALEPVQAHRIEVTAKNRNAWSKAGVQGSAGAELAALTVDLGPPLVPEGADANAGQGQRTAGLILGGVGIAGIAVGSIFGVVTLGKKSDYETLITDQKNCPTKTTCNDGARDSITSARTAISGPAAISTIGFIAGGVLLAGGAVLYFTAPKAPGGTSAARLHVAPAIAPGNAGAVVGGAF